MPFAVPILVISALLVAVAPAFMPRSYDLRTNTISESAAQGVRWAGLARLGLALLGLGAVLAAVASREDGIVRLLQGLFGAAMIASSAWSHRSWVPGAPFRASEDRLHSVAASVAGVFFVAATAVTVIAAWRRGLEPAPLAVAALVTSLVASPAMVWVPRFAGIAQRCMFAVAYAWLLASALSVWCDFCAEDRPVRGRMVRNCPARSGGLPGYSHHTSVHPDYAVIYLDRPVRNIVPALIAPLGSISKFERVWRGLPFGMAGYGLTSWAPGNGHGDPDWGTRRYTTTNLAAIYPGMIEVSQSPGNGCLHDSGGPVFPTVGEVGGRFPPPAFVPIVFGLVRETTDAPTEPDLVCSRGTIDTRLDTALAHDFLDPFVR